MKLKALILLLLCVPLPFFSTAQGVWTWVKGDSIAMAPGQYGVAGVPSPTNEPAGRYACAHWEDTSGNFWIFGANRRDLWMFNPNTTMWTFMNGDTGQNGALSITGGKGVYTATNNPGDAVQGKCGWVTPDNHLWLMGESDNLWQYDPGVNEWAWMGADGPANYGAKGTGTTTTLPGDRVETSAAWTDNNGNLWLFGGDNGLSLNDMWEYNVTTGIWTWMSGTNLTDNTGTYGNIGTGSVNNVPPARSVNTVWKDSSGNFWLAGGEALDEDLYYQDVWQFNPQTLVWTWMSGTQGPDTSSPTGITCVASSTNKQGKRWENRAVWKVCDNLIVNYSGESVGVPSMYYNDMWAYIPSLGQWMKMASAPLAGSFGTQGVASSTNFPRARVGAVGFVDKNKNLWMFGGSTNNGITTGAWFNDLWEYTPDSACVAVASCYTPTLPGLQANATSQNLTCSGTCNGSASVTATSGTPPYHYLWQPDNDTTALISNLCAGNYTVTVTDANNNTVVQSVTVTAPTPPQVTISDDTTVICSGDSTHICATSGFVSYAWNDGSTTSCITTTDAGNYYVTVSDNNQCTAVSNQINISLYQPTPVTVSVNGDTLTSYTASAYQWYLNGQPIAGDTGSSIVVPQTGSYTVTIRDSHGCYYSSNPVAVTGNNDLTVNNEVNVYPNPLQTGSWHLFVSNRLIGSWVEMFDGSGRLVYRARITDSLSELAPDIAGGVYLLRINAGSDNIMMKLVKL